MRLLTGSASANLYVRGGSAGVGLAADQPGETSTIGGVYVMGAASGDQVVIGSGVTITTYEQDSGRNRLRAAATIATVNVLGGELLTESSFTITAGLSRGGIWYANHISGSVAYTTLNIDGGTVDALGSNEARTWATVNHKRGTLRAELIRRFETYAAKPRRPVQRWNGVIPG